jgi:hypothetical protein
MPASANRSMDATYTKPRHVATFVRSATPSWCGSSTVNCRVTRSGRRGLRDRRHRELPAHRARRAKAPHQARHRATGARLFTSSAAYPRTSSSRRQGGPGGGRVVNRLSGDSESVVGCRCRHPGLRVDASGVATSVLGLMRRRHHRGAPISLRNTQNPLVSEAPRCVECVAIEAAVSSPDAQFMIRRLERHAQVRHRLGDCPVCGVHANLFSIVPRSPQAAGPSFVETARRLQ